MCLRLAETLSDQQFVVSVVGEAGAGELQTAIARADLGAVTFRSGKAHDRAELLAQIVKRVDLNEQGIIVALNVAGLQQLLRIEDGRDIDAPLIAIEAVRVRRGHQLRLIVPGLECAQPKPARQNAKLVALVAEAQQAKALVLTKAQQPISRIASEAGRCRARLTKLVALSCLAPDIVIAILEGKQPEYLTANRLMSITLPLSWTEQRAALGFS